MKERLIKKYPNRKLYDVSEKKYVSLRDIEQFIKKREKLTVIESDTQDDITNIILSEIILSRARKGKLPQNFFDVIIRKLR